MAEGSPSRKRGRERSYEDDISSSRHGSSSSSYSSCATTQVQEQIPATTLAGAGAPAVAATAAAAVTATAARNPAGDNPNNSVTFLRKGMVILKGFVSEHEQRELVVRYGRPDTSVLCSLLCARLRMHTAVLVESTADGV